MVHDQTKNAGIVLILNWIISSVIKDLLSSVYCSQVNIFFDGVSARINAGVKEAEISYQLQFSKQELKKVVHAYPGREVRAGLEKLYKKVEKHLSEEENLLQVVWHHMQEEFIRQYKYIEDLLQRCYPGAQICLDFTMEDILEYFSGIAMHH